MVKLTEWLYGMILAHRIALDPTNRQQTYFRRACGVARFAYNWGLAEWKRQYEAGERPNAFSIEKALTLVKQQQFHWMSEVTKWAPQKAVRNLETAFQEFWSKRASHPVFHKKGRRDSFQATRYNGDKQPVRVCGRKFFCPKLGWVRMRQELRFQGKILSAVVSRTADRWFVSFQVEMPDPIPAVREPSIVGVDLGITALATLSTGETITGPRALRANLERLQRACRQVSRKQEGSANREKAKRRVARIHARVANIRKDALHKLTKSLVGRFSVIGIEDLSVENLKMNNRLARSISDMGWGEFRRQLTYKAPLHGAQIVVVDKWYPSSKTCSGCGSIVDKLPLSVRAWTCPACGAHHQRDHNAALNLAALAATRVECTRSNACGDGGSGIGKPIRNRRLRSRNLAAMQMAEV